MPATKEGVPAIQALIGEGHSINVTLIFGLDRYDEVMEQKKKLEHMLVSEGNILDPGFYGGGIEQLTVGSNTAYTVKLKSTTVGLWDGRQWTFYTLRYRKLSGRVYEHHGLHQFVPLV